MLTERTAQELASTGRLVNASAERSLHEVTRIASRGVPGCAAAAVVVWDGIHVREAAASHPDLGTLFELQAERGDGPVLQARSSRQPVLIPDSLRERRWRHFTAAAVRLGVRSTLVLPLEVDDSVVTFALHGARPKTWDERAALPLASLLAAQVAVVLRNVADYEDVSRTAVQLRRALSATSARRS